MGGGVYANGMEIACKAGQAKVIAAFPDVCLSPPSPPAGPVPVPYPVTSMSSDATGGSKSVKISGKEVMLKNKSSYKKCMGDEAATKALGMGVISHNIGGKTYFIMWSMDVKFEGANVDRHLDSVGSNGMSTTNQPAWVNFDKMTFAMIGDCDGVDSDYQLRPYRDKVHGDLQCPKPTTGHHLFPGHLLSKKKTSPGAGTYQAGNGQCHHDTAPVVCAMGTDQRTGTHRDCHYWPDAIEGLAVAAGDTVTYTEMLEHATASAGYAVEGKPLEPGDAAYECVKQQLDHYFEQCGVGPETPLSPVSKKGVGGLNRDMVRDQLLPPEFRR